MDVLCPICKAKHQISSQAAKARRWALCVDCGYRYAQGRLSGGSGGLSGLADPAWVVDGEARLLACNRPAEQLFGAPAAVLLGLAPGELLDCDRARDAGCGAAPGCQACSLRQAILYSLRHDRDTERLPVLLPVTRDGQAQMRCLSLSTRRLNQSVRLHLEEDGILPLH